jgi:hypothetical protein
MRIAGLSGGAAALAAAFAVAVAGCTAAPRPSEQILALERAPKVTVTGVVVDAETGRPVSGIEVSGLPRGKDIPWCPPDTTDRDGRFSLDLAAPAEYSFLLRLGEISVLTSSPDDPGYVDVTTEPGRPISGIRLKFRRKAFENPPE